MARKRSRVIRDDDGNVIYKQSPDGRVTRYINQNGDWHITLKWDGKIVGFPIRKVPKDAPRNPLFLAEMFLERPDDLVAYKDFFRS